MYIYIYIYTYIYHTRTHIYIGYNITVHIFPANPIANIRNISERSWFMPSTASSMLPSFPRSALPLPYTFVIVDIDTHAIFAHIDMIADMCKKYLAITCTYMWVYITSSYTYINIKCNAHTHIQALTWAGISISIRQVVVKPASTAACVAIALKFSVYKFNSYVEKIISISNARQ